MIIAFDFDGTITRYNEYPKCGELRPGIQECINDLYRAGHKIIIFTCRDVQHVSQLEAYIDMVNYLRKNHIQFTIINRNANPVAQFNPIKPYWNILVDDSALGFDENWTGSDIYKLIQAKMETDKLNKENDRTKTYMK